jgi:translation initiation factor 1 (eIF-1/SUI1)
MPLPYENATSGKRAIDDIQKILRSFGCSKFATGSDFETGEIFIQFDHRGRMISLKASDGRHKLLLFRFDEGWF